MDHEVRWRKSSYSGGDNGECVEVAHTCDAFRDSKNPETILLMARSGTEQFLKSLGR